MKNAAPTARADIEALLANRRSRISALDAERTETKDEIGKLERLLKTLDFDPPKVKVETNGKQSASYALRRAGPGNVAKVEEAIRDLGGTASQHRITEHVGLHSGTVSYALKELSRLHKVRTTGKKFGRSPEYQISGSTRALPGS